MILEERSLCMTIDYQVTASIDCCCCIVCESNFGKGGIKLDTYIRTLIHTKGMGLRLNKYT